MVLTLFFLENSRAFRVLWLAKELNTPIQVRNYPRLEGKKAVRISLSPERRDRCILDLTF